MATHSPELTFLVSDRILLLEGGKVMLSGTPAELLRNDRRLCDAALPVWERLW
jgi:ABC-type multidrug transport system ATPase subunit